MLLEGSLSAKVLFVSDFQRINCAAEGRVMSQGLAQPLLSSIKQAGLREADYAFACVHPRTPPGGKEVFRIPVLDREADIREFKAFLATHGANVIVPLGDYAFELLTGLESLSKWHCSVVRLKAEYEGRKAIPLFHPEYISRSYGDSFYLSVGCQKIREQQHFPQVATPERKFLLSPSVDDTIAYLESRVNQSATIALDIETGQGMINTVGFAISPTEAIAIKVLPESHSPQQHLKLWQVLAGILESEQPKVLQNFIYEATWFSRYGIEMRGTVHDTMWAMKFLHPELDKGLDNVGRIYTPYPYWKDDNDNWTQIRDWHRHLDYNCKDTTGTFAAYEAQLETLAARGLKDLFQQYVMRFAPVIQEMCTRGLRLDPASLEVLKAKLGREQESAMRILDQEFMTRLGRHVNPRSPKQLQAALKELGMRLPTKRAKGKDEHSETTDKKALVKLRKKYPKEQVLPALIGLSATNKQLSSYVDFEYDRQASRVRYQLDGCGTETGRWAGYNSGWGEGFNPQTVPKSVRNCFIADEGKVLIQVDLAQAESRYVAWEAPEPTLIKFLSEGRDVHKYVAGKIFRKPEEIVSYQERQLGKKSGHSANYSVGPRTFAEACLVEMNLHLEEHEAKRIIETYFEVFPGIRRRQENIRKEVYHKRMLRTPIGRERHFYGRMDDGTFREAYAYCPQSVIPDITNHLMLKLWDLRDCLECEFLLQVHDSLLLQAPAERVEEIAAVARDLESWHPRITLAGGELWIPTTIEIGQRWGKLENI